MIRQTHLNISDFIYPLFVIDGENVKNVIESMPDIYQMSIDNILIECQELLDLNIKSIILFAIPSYKDAIGSEALEEDSLISRTIQAIKSKYPSMFVISDLCFCEYTDHGHCGILDDCTTVDNDKTLALLNKQAIVHLQAGVDMIAPSGMMDGVISSLRICMDNAGFNHIPIMSYSTKFSSAYYGPFRDIAQSSMSFSDRKSYQMDGANRDEAILESIEDVKQGADLLMVKPALAYLDIVYQIKQITKIPLAVYNVSGEYAMLKLASKNNLLDYNQVMMETMISFKRAGADIIISYHAKDVARLLN
jgi:porphobilinogen synthase